MALLSVQKFSVTKFFSDCSKFNFKRLSDHQPNSTPVRVNGTAAASGRGEKCLSLSAVGNRQSLISNYTVPDDSEDELHKAIELSKLEHRQGMCMIVMSFTQKGMSTKFPRCKYTPEFQEIFCQNHMLSFTECLSELRNNAITQLWCHLALVLPLQTCISQDIALTFRRANECCSFCDA